jgi:electron transfer flavoprotein alpha subunit
MANKILVYIEQRNGQIKKSSLEAARTAASLSAKLNIEAEAVIVGNSVANPELIGGYGIPKVKLFTNDQLENYSSSAYTDLVSAYAQKINADIILFSNTALGKDLAPRVAVKLNAGIAADCTELNFDNNEYKAIRPIFAGKALAEVKINSTVKVFVLRPNVFPAGDNSGELAEVSIENVDSPNLSVKVIEVKKAEGKLDVAEANIIVSGGRGMKGPEHFHLVEELADAIGGAAYGASRAVVDAGWRPHGEQVGQTGKTVSPNLYIALGISGAIQHLAGMRSSKYIVAINKDKDAPIFQAADYGIVGDVFEVVPALIEEIKKLKA